MMFKWTLSRELGLFLVLQALVLMFVYSQLLPYTLWNGVQQAAAVFLETDARAAQAVQQAQGALPSNNGRSIAVYDAASLPPAIKALFPAAEDLPPGELRIRRGGGLSLMALAHEPTDGERVIAVYNVPDEVLSRPGGAMDRMFELLQFGGRIGLAVVLFWAVLTIFVVRRIYLRTRRMSRWTQALTAEHEREDPRFGYREFDDVGRELNQAFARISAALEREREFVRNASHELRTPLTIIQANVALAQEQAVSGEPLARVERAATRMQKLVETLLWLSREESASQAPEPVDLHELLEQLIEEHRYLLRGRQVSILDQCQQSSVTLAPEPARIALGNLLRNAFEHSSDDDAIEVSVDGGSVMIRNRVADDAGGAQPGAGSDGLGLTLVRRVTDRMGWDFYVSTGPAQHCVRLSFGAFG